MGDSSQQEKKKRFSHLLGFVELRLSPPQGLPLGITIKSKNRKRAGGRWEEGKGGSRPLFSLPIVPRALSFSLSLALPTIKRGEASVGERREELWREFFDKLGTVNNKSFETSSTRIWISLKRRFFSPFSKKYESTKRIRIVFAHPSFSSPQPLGLICNELLVSRPRDQETTGSGDENRNFKQ